MVPARTVLATDVAGEMPLTDVISIAAGADHILAL